MQTMLLQCMQEQQLDALVSPTSTGPQADIPARADTERPSGYCLVADRSAGVSGDYCACLFHDECVGACCGWGGDAAGWADSCGVARGGGFYCAAVWGAGVVQDCGGV
jgi:hypothetical protein